MVPPGSTGCLGRASTTQWVSDLSQGTMSAPVQPRCGCGLGCMAAFMLQAPGRSPERVAGMAPQGALPTGPGRSHRAVLRVGTPTLRPRFFPPSVLLLGVDLPLAPRLTRAEGAPAVLAKQSPQLLAPLFPAAGPTRPACQAGNRHLQHSSERHKIVQSAPRAALFCTGPQMPRP